MCVNLDTKLDEYCDPHKIEEIYWNYKRSKVDQLLAKGEPTFIDMMIRNGASLEEVLNFSHPSGNLPAADTKTFISQDGKTKVVRLIAVPMGADGVTTQVFQDHLEQHCTQIGGRLQKGNYLFYPFREVVIDKENPRPPSKVSLSEIDEIIKGKHDRRLAVASIRDVIVQQVIYQVAGGEFERLFRQFDRPKAVSFAYRKGKSPSKAVRQIYQYIRQGFVHVLDADIAKFFDTIPVNNLLSAVGEVVCSDTRVYQLIRRFILVDRIPYRSYAYDEQGKYIGSKAFFRQSASRYPGPHQPARPQRVPPTEREHPNRGIPQGGVLSGMLANLYLHRFDAWVIQDLAKRIELRYVRYADDFVILTRAAKDVLTVYQEVKAKIELPYTAGGLDLEMHAMDENDVKSEAAKTRYVDVTEKPLKFVGFHINQRKIRVYSREDEQKPGNIQRFKKRWVEAVKYEEKLCREYLDPHKRLKQLIRQRLRFKIYGRTETVICKQCGRPRMKRRSWLAFFSIVTDKRQIRKLDKWMRQQIYRQFQDVWPDMKHEDLKEAGYPGLYREYYRVKEMCRPCACRKKPIDESPNVDQTTGNDN